MSDDLTIRLRRGSGTPGPSGRALSAAAALGGVVAALGSLLLCLALALTAWYLADAGAHGDTTDALRAGADVWLIGHGSRFVLNGMPLGIVPMTLTALLLVGAFRSGRRAADRAEDGQDDHTLGLGVITFVGVYVVVAVVVCVAASQTAAEPGLGRSVLGALLVSGVGGGLGLATGTGRLEVWTGRVPGWVREVLVAALVGAALLAAAGALLVAGSLLASFNEAANVLSGLDLSTGDAVTLTVVMALFAPNAALFGSAYLLGPGFAVGSVASGVATSVSPGAPVVLGAVPAVPLFAALPDQGPTPGWLILICGVPVLCAGLGVALAGRSSTPLPLDLAAIRGAAAGFVGAVVTALAITASGGPLGVDRLADVGAAAGDVFLFAVASMVIGGALGGVLQSWWQRR
ncbi:MAG: DUF6350 family protein [Propionibacteriales bacterium]|nr:DUF6350 family protein [Propionibacteriales bacterium]